MGAELFEWVAELLDWQEMKNELGWMLLIDSIYYFTNRTNNIGNGKSFLLQPRMMRRYYMQCIMAQR